MLNEVLQCVSTVNRVHCALGCVYILLTLIFCSCTRRAHVRYKGLINTLFTLHLHYSNRNATRLSLIKQCRKAILLVLKELGLPRSVLFKIAEHSPTGKRV